MELQGKAGRGAVGDPIQRPMCATCVQAVEARPAVDYAVRWAAELAALTIERDRYRRALEAMSRVPSRWEAARIAGQALRK